MKRTFIVVLVVLALLYLAALAVGFHMNASEPPNLSAIQKSWVSRAGRWLAGFGPRLDLAGLRCDGQPADRLITLTEAKPSCSMDIPKASDEYRKTSVQVVGAGADVYVLAQFDKKRFPPAQKDPDCFLEGTVPPGLKLEVRYEPEGKQEGGMWSCWLRKRPDEPVDVVAMKDGGTLTLGCEGCCESCDAHGRRVIRLQMR